MFFFFFVLIESHVIFHFIFYSRKILELLKAVIGFYLYYSWKKKNKDTPWSLKSKQYSKLKYKLKAPLLRLNFSLFLWNENSFCSIYFVRIPINLYQVALALASTAKEMKIKKPLFNLKSIPHFSFLLQTMTLNK